MARLGTKTSPVRPWKAEVKVNHNPRFLGYYPTREVAEQIEADARLRFAGRTRKGQRRVAR
jgi:hypothetical protein